MAVWSIKQFITSTYGLTADFTILNMETPINRIVRSQRHAGYENMEPVSSISVNPNFKTQEINA